MAGVIAAGPGGRAGRQGRLAGEHPQLERQTLLAHQSPRRHNGGDYGMEGAA
jgi:hypothetical protein